LPLESVTARGFLVVPTLVVREAVERYKFRVIGEATGCSIALYAITGERRIHHPAVALITHPTAKTATPVPPPSAPKTPRAQH
jgi:hypothetical protein